MNFLKGKLNSDHPYGLGSGMRMRRHAFFLSLLDSLPGSLSILDIGGTEIFWTFLGFSALPQIRITLFNQRRQNVTSPQIASMVGDATDMKELQDQSFDIIFSNSVLEHVGGFEAQNRMAKEVMRVGKRFFIQTPNYWFPVEPHFLFPGFQWLPVFLRIQLIQHFDLGWHRKTSDPDQARALIDHNRLLTKQELIILFPQAKLYEELFLGLVKSFIAYGGWGQS